jgi:hypothetical protein
MNYELFNDFYWSATDNGKVVKIKTTKGTFYTIKELQIMPVDDKNLNFYDKNKSLICIPYSEVEAVMVSE